MANEPQRLLFQLDRSDGGVSLIRAGIIDDRGAFMGRAWRGRLGALDEPPDIESDQITAAELEAYGDNLFEALANGELRDAWEQAQADGVTRLAFDIRCPKLRALPWELLRDPNGDSPFDSERSPAVRVTAPYVESPPKLDLPVHMLVVVGDAADKGLNADEEIDAIYRGLCEAPCCWQLDVLSSPGKNKLRNAFKEIAPHVVHFIGHGVRTGNGAALQIASPGETWQLTAGFVSGALGTGPPPRLAVLNACRTGEGALVRGVATSFLRQGGETTAVVSTQGKIASSAGIRFTEGFYRRLVGGAPLDVAVAGARNDIRFADGMGPSDWVMPVLTTRMASFSVLDHTVERKPADVFREFEELRDVRHLVDRTADRRQVYRSFGSPPEGGLLFVTGDPEIGKSLLLRSCVMTRTISGQRAIYVSLEGRPMVSEEDFISLIAKQAPRWLGVSAEALSRDMLAAAPEEPVMLPRPGFVGGYTKLQGLLVNLAKPGSLLVVLDAVDRVHDEELFAEQLLRPAALKQLPGVQLVVAGQSHRVRDLAKTDLAELGFEVKLIPKKQALSLVREYLTRSRPADVDDRRWEVYRQSMMDWARQRENKEIDVAPVELVEQSRSQRRASGL